MLLRALTRRMPTAPAKSASVAAPLGGLNTTDPIAQMPATDAVAIQNLIPSEWGLRARLGSLEWCTTLDGVVLSILPFNAANPSNDKLFATTSTGIWDCTSSSAAPSRVFAFSTVTGSAGVGASCVMVTTAAGHFLVYCDEENGYLLFSESTGDWTTVQDVDTTTAWAITTGYTAGQYVKNGGNVYLCTQTGTSAGAGGPTGTGTGIVDGTCHWNYNFSVSGVTPSAFCHVMAWKNRLWFTQKGTALSWYLGINAVGGAATAFNFGGQFKVGGPLVGLWNWTTDGGIGVDDYLVAISGSGDVAVYQGTDPASASTFGLRGVWSVGSLPSGRRVATGFGGDILIASMLGLVPLSKVVLGNVTFDRSQYLTAKVQNLFNYYTGLYGSNSGWALVLDPKDNALLVLVPITQGSPSTQLAMSMSTRGWFPYAGLAMNCAASWNGTLYFGTTDGRVVKHDGYVDGVTLADPSASTAIQWNVVHAYNNLGTPSQKRMHLIRPTVLSQGEDSVPLQTAAKWDFDSSALGPTAGNPAPGNNTWDSGTWDSSQWDGDYVTNRKVFGAVDMGVYASIAIAGLANSRTVYTGADVTFELGGFL